MGNRETGIFILIVVVFLGLAVLVSSARALGNPCRQHCTPTIEKERWLHPPLPRRDMRAKIDHQYQALIALTQAWVEEEKNEAR